MWSYNKNWNRKKIKSNNGDQGNFKNDENFCDNVESYQKFVAVLLKFGNVKLIFKNLSNLF